MPNLRVRTRVLPSHQGFAAGNPLPSDASAQLHSPPSPHEVHLSQVRQLMFNGYRPVVFARKLALALGGCTRARRTGRLDSQARSSHRGRCTYTMYLSTPSVTPPRPTSASHPRVLQSVFVCDSPWRSPPGYRRARIAPRFVRR